MKKFKLGSMLCALGLAVLLACGFSGEAHAEEPIDTMKAVQAVYMRSGPDTTYGVLTTIPGGAEVKVYNVDKDWYEVEYNGKRGYTYCSFLESKTTKSSAVSYGSGWTMYATTGVRVRTGPSTGHAVLATLQPGEAIDVIGSDSGWYQVNYHGNNGYVYADYLSKTAPAKSSTESSSSKPASESKPASQEVKGEKYKTSTSLRIRKTPSNNGDIIGLIPAGATVGVVSKGHGDDGWWFEVNYDGITGYSYAYYLYK